MSSLLKYGNKVQRTSLYWLSRRWHLLDIRIWRWICREWRWHGKLEWFSSNRVQSSKCLCQGCIERILSSKCVVLPHCNPFQLSIFKFSLASMCRYKLRNWVLNMYLVGLEAPGAASSAPSDISSTLNSSSSELVSASSSFGASGNMKPNPRGCDSPLFQIEYHAMNRESSNCRGCCTGSSANHLTPDWRHSSHINDGWGKPQEKWLHKQRRMEKMIISPMLMSKSFAIE